MSDPENTEIKGLPIDKFDHKCRGCLNHYGVGDISKFLFHVRCFLSIKPATRPIYFIEPLADVHHRTIWDNGHDAA